MRPILIGAVIGVCFAGMVLAFGFVMGFPLLGPSLPSLLVVLYVAGLSSLVEEVIFRGPVLIASRIWGNSRGIWAIVLFQALVFGALHVLLGRPYLSTFLTTSAMGLIAGLLAWKFKSLWPAVMEHAFYNLTLLFLG